MTFDAFSQARKLGLDVLLWGKTRNPLVQIVLVQGSTLQRDSLHAYCFDLTNGGFYDGTDCREFADGQAAFLSKLNQVAACHQSHD